jgi:hypothetical protein
MDRTRGRIYLQLELYEDGSCHLFSEGGFSIKRDVLAL